MSKVWTPETIYKEIKTEQAPKWSHLSDDKKERFTSKFNYAIENIIEQTSKLGLKNPPFIEKADTNAFKINEFYQDKKKKNCMHIKK